MYPVRSKSSRARRSRFGHGFQKKTNLLKIKPLRIKPGADARLESIFSTIGIPEKKPFIPDPFQLDAVTAISKADCLVTAPTGAGKTWIAEKAIEKTIQQEGRSWYATPLKALSNAIYANFIEIFGTDNVGILTGDKKENPDAPIIVGTTEILRNQLYDAMHRGKDLNTDLVVLDEAHFLGDVDRGVVWEEIMIYLPSRIPILMLSATIGNADVIAGWLSSIRFKKCITIKENKRPVPLYPLFFHPSGTLLPLISSEDKKGKAVIYKKVVSYMHNKHAPAMAPPSKLPPMGDVIRVLRKYNLMPAIFFLKSRRDCDNALNLCTQECLANDPDRKIRLSKKIHELIGQSPLLAKHKQLWQLEHLGVGAHHSGQLPAWKTVVETLMKEGLLNAVFATSTVAAGVNFPARTVVILNSDRFNGVEFLPLSPTEFHQMTGRSGRRGMDNIGFAMLLPGRFMDIKLISKLINASPADVTSQIRINFSMVLNLLLSHSPVQIEELLEKCFAAYLNEKKENRSQLLLQNDHRYLWRDFLQHLNFLKENGYVSKKDKLTSDGRWASKLRIDQPLIVAEAFRLGVIPESDPTLIAAIMASFVNDREANDEGLNSDLIPKKLLSVFLNIKKRLRPFAKKMTSRGFNVRPLCLTPACTIYNWAKGQPWEKVVKDSGISEGDVARLILRTADHLRHIRNLNEIFPQAAASSALSIELIKREPIIEYYGA